MTGKQIRNKSSGVVVTVAESKADVLVASGAYEPVQKAAPARKRRSAKTNS